MRFFYVWAPARCFRVPGPWEVVRWNQYLWKVWPPEAVVLVVAQGASRGRAAVGEARQACRGLDACGLADPMAIPQVAEPGLPWRTPRWPWNAEGCSSEASEGLRVLSFQTPPPFADPPPVCLACAAPHSCPVTVVSAPDTKPLD